MGLKRVHSGNTKVVVIYCMLSNDVVMPKPRHVCWPETGTNVFLQFFVFSSRDEVKKANEVTEPCGSFDRHHKPLTRPGQIRLLLQTPCMCGREEECFIVSKFTVLFLANERFYLFSPACELPSHSHMRQEIKWNYFYQNKNKSLLLDTFQRVQ